MDKKFHDCIFPFKIKILNENTHKIMQFFVYLPIAATTIVTLTVAICIVVNLELKHDDKGYVFPYLSQLGWRAPESWILIAGVGATTILLAIVVVYNHKLLASYSMQGKFSDFLLYSMTVSGFVWLIFGLLLTTINSLTWPTIHGACAFISIVFFICFAAIATLGYSWVTTDSQSIWFKLVLATIYVYGIITFFAATFWLYCAGNPLLPTGAIQVVFTISEYISFLAMFGWFATLTIDFLNSTTEL